MPADKPKVEIYSSASCAFCVAAKNLLKQRSFEYQEFRIDTDPVKFDEMLSRAKRRTVPQIFINDEHIGGFQELADADRNGTLAKFAAT